MSLMYNRKRRGPMAVRCGTADNKPTNRKG